MVNHTRWITYFLVAKKFFARRPHKIRARWVCGLHSSQRKVSSVWTQKVYSVQRPMKINACDCCSKYWPFRTLQYFERVRNDYTVTCSHFWAPHRKLSTNILPVLCNRSVCPVHPLRLVRLLLFFTRLGIPKLSIQVSLYRLPHAICASGKSQVHFVPEFLLININFHNCICSCR